MLNIIPVWNISMFFRTTAAARVTFDVFFPARKSFPIHTRKSGTLRSPGFPDSPYAPNTYLEWKLRAEPGHRVKLDFDTFMLEEDCQQDFIKIYDSLAPIEHRVLTE